MKTSVLLVILFFVVGVGAWSYHHKFSKTWDDMDSLETALQGVKDIVPAGSSISFASGMDITICSQGKYILAPGIVLADNMDTVLVIHPLQDSTLPTGTFLWQHTDDRYKYYITTGNAE